MTETLRIAYVIPTLSLGGAERQQITIANGMAQRGAEVSVFVLKNETALAAQLSPSVKLDVIGMRGPCDLFAWLRLLFKLRAIRPHILHTQMFKANLIGRSLKPFLPGTKLINHIHGLSRWLHGVLLLLDRVTAFLADRIIVVSEKSRRLRIERERYRADHLVTIYNSIETERYAAPPRSRGPKDPIILGMASRLIPLKRIDRAIVLIRKLSEAGLDIELRIAGEGPERAALEERVRQNGVSARVRFLGLIADMPGFYRTIDVLLLTSEVEDLPVTIIEAIAAGKAIISTDVGGVSELKSDAGFFHLMPNEALFDHQAVLTFLKQLDMARCAERHNAFARGKFENGKYIDILAVLYGEVRS